MKNSKSRVETVFAVNQHAVSTFHLSVSVYFERYN